MSALRAHERGRVRACFGTAQLGFKLLDVERWTPGDERRFPCGKDDLHHPRSAREGPVGRVPSRRPHVARRKVVPNAEVRRSRDDALRLRWVD